MNQILKTYKFRIYPTEDQKKLINETFGCVRFYWNKALSESKENYKKIKKGYYRTPAKYKEEFPFLKEVDSLALCNTQLNLKSAFSNFYRRLKQKKKGKELGFPKYKSKKDNHQSYTTNNITNSIRIEKGKLRLPKLGLIKTVFHRYVLGDIRSATVSKTPTEKYYVSILTKQDLPVTERVVEGEEKVTGIDMSFSQCAVLSNGEKTNFLRYYRKSEDKLRRANRKLHKKKLGSQNRNKQRIKVTTIHEKIANQRKDFLHNLSYNTVKNSDVVVVEDINLQGMAKRGDKRKFGKSISDIGFGEFRRQLQYKCENQSKKFVVAPKYFPSTQLCSVCGYKNKELKDISIRKWVCPVCNTTHDRDENAAKNLENYYKSTAATAGSNAYGNGTSTSQIFELASTIDEIGKIAKLDLASSYL